MVVGGHAAGQDFLYFSDSFLSLSNLSVVAFLRLNVGADDGGGVVERVAVSLYCHGVDLVVDYLETYAIVDEKRGV